MAAFVDHSTVVDQTVEPLRSRRNNWNNQVVRHALMDPGGVALRFQGAALTWGELERRVSGFADALAQRGVAFGDRVLIVMLNRPEYLEVVLAANLIGAIAVPVNFRMTPPEIAFLAEDSGARVVISDGPLESLVTAVRQQVGIIEVSVTVGGAAQGEALDYERLIAEENATRALVDVPDDTPALIMYTSGTTGRPKGAVLTHANLQAQAFTCIRALQMHGTDEIGFCASPMFHIAALGSLAPSILLGVTTVVHPTGAFDPGQLLDVLESEGVTTLFLVPVQWQAVCAEQAVRARKVALRVISWGAAPASDTVLRAMADTFPDALNVAVFGQTEMSPITCVLDGKDALRKLGSVGKVIPTIQARVVDEEMNDVAPGQVGEIVYRGPTLMQGYWRNEQGTADAFYGGWFHSGDVVRQDEEGFVFVVDRKKDMIISGGENIYCAEVENVLYGHPQVAEVAVIGRADEKWGEVPVAVAALKSGELTVQELSAWLDDKLARFKHPKDLVVVDALPRNASGKVVKGQLRSAYELPAARAEPK